MNSKNEWLILVIIVFASTITPTPIPTVRADEQWLAGEWDQRFNFTIESDRIAGDTTTIIRLRLSANSGIGSTDVTTIFDEVGANYKKIAITNSSGHDEVEVEVSRWDDANEEAELWIRVPADSATDTEYYLYYDNDHADNTNIKDPGAASSVWLTASDEMWLRVYHLSENAGDFIDSSNTFNVSDSSVNLRQQEGRNGSYAVDFDNANPDYLNLGDMNLENYDDLTFFIMTYPDDTSHGSAALMGCIPTQDQFLIYVPSGTSDWRAFMYDDGFRNAQTSDMDTDQWANVFVQYKLNSNPGWWLYVADDDQVLTLEASTLTDAGNMDPPNPAATPVGVGAVVSGGDLVINDLPYDGLIDEAWIANSQISTTDMSAISYGFFDDLLNWGVSEDAEEPVEPPATALVNLRFITAEGEGVEGVAVMMENSTDVLFDVLTNSTGHIAEQNITQANITLTATHSDYSDYIHDYEVTESISWVIRLGTGDGEMPGLILFIFVALSVITFLGMVMSSSLAISVSAGALSFICWGVSALYYLYENYAFPGPAWLFALFATISLLYTIYAGMKLMNPYDREAHEV